MKKQLLTSLILFSSLCTGLHAQKDIHGTYIYQIQEDRNITFIEARLQAVQHARQEALKEAFGVNLLAETSIVTESTDGISHETMMDIMSESIKGEWLQDISEPKVNVTYDSDTKTFSYIVTVNGKAQERTNAKTDFSWKTLIGDNWDNAKETTTVTGKQRLYVTFKSPQSGYLAIYLRDSDKMYCMLPYKNSGIGSYHITAGQEYIFFDQRIDRAATPLSLSTTDGIQLDAIHIIFSPKPFTKCSDNVTGANKLGEVEIKDFNKWLNDNKMHDKSMEDDHKWIKIVKGN